MIYWSKARGDILRLFLMLGMIALLSGCMAGGRQLFLSRGTPSSDEPTDGEPTGGEPAGQPTVLSPTTTFSSTQASGQFVSSGGFSGYVSMGPVSGPRAGSANYEMVGIPVATAAGLGLELSVSEGVK